MPYADPERALERRRAYQKSDEGKVRHAAATKAWRQRNKKRLAAHNAVNKALLRGHMEAWPVCAIPECCGKPEAHHADYDNPLGVTWLCDAHHKQAHAIAKELETS